MVKESVTEYKKAVDLSDGNPFAIACLASRYYQIGGKDKADKLFESVKKRSETEYVPATAFYRNYRAQGKEDLALEWLKRACIEHDTFLPYFRVYPAFIPEGSKYMKLLKALGLDY